MSNRGKVRWSWLAAGVLVSLSAGCAETGSTWNAGGYRQAVFGYAVAYRDKKAHTMVGADWQVDNHRRDAATGEWTEKTGTEYMANREEDIDGDGTISSGERSEEPIYDLRFLNKKNNGVLWTKAHPFLLEQADRELDVILDNYVDSLSGNGLYAQGSLFGIERTKTRNFTTFLVSKAVGRIGGRDALVSTIEIAEVDRLKQDPKHRSGVVRLALVKMRCLTLASCRRDGGGLAVQTTGSEAVLTAASDKERLRWPMVDCRGKPCRARTGLLIVGYYNTPKYFVEGEAEFEDLLGRVSFPDAEPLPVPKPAAPSPPDTPVAPEADTPASESKDPPKAP